MGLVAQALGFGDGELAFVDFGRRQMGAAGAKGGAAAACSSFGVA